jgi:purine nucleoside permease
MKALVAIDRTSKFVVVELVERADMQAAAAFRFRYASKLASRVPNKTFCETYQYSRGHPE